MRMIRKAVIHAAGFGTRFLPATKSQPKEMLPIVDTPTIQYVVEEAVAAGITDILMVIGKNKRAIEEYFDRNFELEAELAAKNRTAELQLIRHISDMANVHFVWQKEMRGLGDAIAHARCHVGDEPFAVLLGDTIFDARRPVVGQLGEVFAERGKSVVAMEEVEMSRVSRYGVVKGRAVSDRLCQVEDFIEKPSIEEAPSNQVIAARYIFTPEIFDYLDRVQPGKNNEIQITDAMRMMVREHEMYGLLVDGKREDIGNKLGFIKTNLSFALRDADIADDLREYIRQLASSFDA